MKPSTRTSRSRQTAFTLIELLVVIAVIGILAALLFPLTGILKKNRVIKVAQTELEQMQAAIDSYKARYGTFPPDNPGNFVINQLYFELEGTVQTNNSYQTLDGSGMIPTASVQPTFGNVSGFVNSGASVTGSDDKAAPEKFLKELKPAQIGALTTGSSIKVLTCSVLWDQATTAPISGSDPVGANPWRYISTHPTNNVGTYDLWVDVLIGGQTNRISNWSKTPQIVYNFNP